MNEPEFALQYRRMNAGSALRAVQDRRHGARDRGGVRQGRVRRLADDPASRALNVVVAAVGLVLTAPLMLIIAILIKLTSRGPVIYSQTRVGLNRREQGGIRPDCRRQRDQGGQPFHIYKFRTMCVDESASQVWADPDDPRITPIGRVLRKLRLDELPQLVNVLKGDMNVVGPRPEQPALFDELRTKVARYSERQMARPGITGWAQVNQSYDTCVDDVRRKVEFDLEYIQQKSLRRDLEIMLKTVPVIIFRKGGW